MYVYQLDCSWDSRQYPIDVETALEKAGNNRRELEKVWDYFIKKGDQQMLQAAYFLIRNMDIHYTETYYLTDTTGRKVEFL